MQNLITSVFVSLCALWLVFFTGCSASAKRVKVAQDQALEAYELQKPIFVQTSENDKRPKWTHETAYESEGKVCFTGAFLNGSDYPLSIRCANAEALKVAVQAISQFIRAEFTSHVQGSNTGASGVDRYVSDGIATFADCLHVQGVNQSEVYYEETFSPAVMQPTYNVFVRLEMSKVDYLRAKAEVVRKLRDKFAKAGELEAKEKAEEILEKLKEQVRNEA